MKPVNSVYACISASTSLRTISMMYPASKSATTGALRFTENVATLGVLTLCTTAMSSGVTMPIGTPPSSYSFMMYCTAIV